MCEAKAYIIDDKGKEELLLEAVSSVKKEGDKIFLRNIFAEERELQGEIREISLPNNKILLKRKG